MTTRNAPKGELVLYQTDDQRTRIGCPFEGDTIWLMQVRPAEPFETSVPSLPNFKIRLNAVKRGWRARRRRMTP